MVTLLAADRRLAGAAQVALHHGHAFDICERGVEQLKRNRLKIILIIFSRFLQFVASNGDAMETSYDWDYYLK